MILKAWTQSNIKYKIYSKLQLCLLILCIIAGLSFQAQLNGNCIFFPYALAMEPSIDIYNMAYAYIDDKYSTFLTEFRGPICHTVSCSILMPTGMHAGLSGSWHGRSTNITFGECITNRLESVNCQCTGKSCFKTGSSLPQFFEDLTAVMWHKRQHTLLMSTDNVSINSYPSDSMHAQFSLALTLFAANMSLKQLHLA